MVRFRWRPAVFAVVFLFVWVLLAPATGRQLLRALDSTFPRIPVSQCQKADAIVVLSGDGRPRLSHLATDEPLSRSETGLALFHAGRAQILIFTDGGPEGYQSRSAAIQDGVPADRILVIGSAIDTGEEARLVAETAEQRQWHRVILVTSGYHMGRARMLLTQAAAKLHIRLEVFPFPGDSGKHYFHTPGLVDFIPTYDVSGPSARALREIVGQLLCHAGAC